MKVYLTRRTLLAAGLATWATAGLSAPIRYDLSPKRSKVAFHFSVQGSQQTGMVPITQTDVRVDPSDLAASSADVTANIQGARTGTIFVTKALLSASILDAKQHPTVRFKSTKVRLGAQERISEGARIEGQLTLRGVTLPISLDAKLSRPAGSAPDDLSMLNVDLTGTLSRKAFGAVGYPKLVADIVTLDIHAEIQARV